MSAAFTVVLPHLRNTGNNRALQVALDCLMENTVNDFKLLMDITEGDPLYPRINALVEQVDTEYACITSSDIFLAPAWDVPMLDAVDEDTFVTGVVVEPGVIGVHDQNVWMDFGRTPDTYDRAGFEAWARSSDVFPPGDGWVVPLMFPVAGWRALGGLDTRLEFPKAAADQVLIDQWRAGGDRVQRVRSYAYHLQRYCEPEEQAAEKRR